MRAPLKNRLPVSSGEIGDAKYIVASNLCKKHKHRRVLVLGKNISILPCPPNNGAYDCRSNSLRNGISRRDGWGEGRPFQAGNPKSEQAPKSYWS
jgi:hypothetical protein